MSSDELKEEIKNLIKENDELRDRIVRLLATARKARIFRWCWFMVNKIGSDPNTDDPAKSLNALKDELNVARDNLFENVVHLYNDGIVE